MRGASLERVLRLVGLLQRRRWRIEELALQLGVTTRTIRRDLEILSVAGFVVRGGFYGDETDRQWSIGYDGRCCVCQRV